MDHWEVKRKALQVDVGEDHAQKQENKAQLHNLLTFERRLKKLE